MRNHLLQHLLDQSAAIYPDKVAILFKCKSITYAELHNQSNEFAFKLTRMGIVSGDRVGIMLTKSIETIVSLFGILKTGAIYVPIDPAAPINRVKYIINHCGIECLVSSPQQLITLFSAPEEKTDISKVILVGKMSEELHKIAVNYDYFSSDDQFMPGQHELIPKDVSDSTPAYILHTSGSTGKPKGVAISHLNALTFVNTAADFFEISSTDRFCNHAPLHFDLSVFDIFVAVKCGATIVLLPELFSTFPVKLAEIIDKEQITIWNSVSSVLKLLADKGNLKDYCFDSLRIIHFSGDVMPVKYLRVLAKHMNKAAFYNIYGQTEANSSLYYPIREISENDAWKIPIGKSFPNFDVFALNDAQEIISRAGEEGELYVCSSSVALGYWGEKSLTDEKFVVDPRYAFPNKIVYKTGDLVRIDDNGDFVFSGRKDHMIKSRGYRIELEEIETVLSSHPEIVTAIVVPIPDELIGNRIAAIILPTNDNQVNKDEVIRYCTLRLPKYMVPEFLDFRDYLPMTSSGKVDRKSLATALREI